MTEALPAPLTPPDCNLHDFEFMPVMVRRLLKSDTWALGNGDERAAAVALWFESWHQVPAASLPEADRLLGRLADSPKWNKVREQALRGWLLCSDRRLYHPVVAEKALEAWIEKLLSAIAGSTGNAKRWNVQIDTSADVQRLRIACDLLLNLNPKSKTLRKKGVLGILSPLLMASGGDSGGDWVATSGGDSGGDRNRQGQGQGLLGEPNGSPIPPVKPARKVGKKLAAVPDANRSPTPKRKCPETFTVTAQMVEYVGIKAPSIDWVRQTEKFRNHEFKHAYTDWSATWRNWMLEAQDRFEAAHSGAMAGAERLSRNSLAMTGETAYQRSQRERVAEATGGRIDRKPAVLGPLIAPAAPKESHELPLADRVD